MSLSSVVIGKNTLVNALGNKRILRTKDVYQGEVAKVEIEDILRETLLVVAKEQLGWDVTDIAEKQPKRPIVEIFTAVVKNDFSKFKLAKAFIRWTKEHCLADLTTNEAACAENLISKVNKALVHSIFLSCIVEYYRGESQCINICVH